MTQLVEPPASARPRSRAADLATAVRLHAHRLGHVPGEHRRVLRAIASCRTAALGGHVSACDRCGHRAIAYNSCRDRHCPRCQARASARWTAARAAELLPVEYFHVVFTLPDDLNALALRNRRAVHAALLNAAARALLDVAADPRHLGARVGVLAVLHTWGQNLALHPHVHCVVPGGGLSNDGARWVPCRSGFFLPVRVLSRVFRGKFVTLLRRAREAGRLAGVDDDRAFDRLLDRAVRREWVVYAKPPFGGPQRVLRYLARYTHRVAVSDRRILAVDERSVTFAWKDYARDSRRRRAMTLDGREFLRRFLLHAVPRGFVRVRHFGLLARRARAANLAACRRLLGAPVCDDDDDADADDACTGPPCCPACGRGYMIAGPPLSPSDLAVAMIVLHLNDSS
jgi:hypothetical protein